MLRVRFPSSGSHRDPAFPLYTSRKLRAQDARMRARHPGRPMSSADTAARKTDLCRRRRSCESPCEYIPITVLFVPDNPECDNSTMPIYLFRYKKNRTPRSVGLSASGASLFETTARSGTAHWDPLESAQRCDADDGPLLTFLKTSATVERPDRPYVRSHSLLLG